MKTIGHLFLIIILGQNINAQNYYKTLGDTNIWNVVEYWGEGSCVESYATKDYKDINSTSYRILGHAAENLITEFGYLREDTINKKIYIRSNIEWTGIDSEFVYIDYSLIQGDSIFLYNVSALSLDTLGYYIVDSVKQAKTILGLRKALYLRSLKKIGYHNSSEYFYDYQYPIWIEGVGSLSSPLIPHTTPNPEKVEDDFEDAHYFYNNELTCSYKDNILVYQSDFSLSAGCIWCKGWGPVQSNTLNNKIIAYPNPVKDILHIDNKSTEILFVNLVAINGSRVLSFNLLDNTNNTLDVSFLPQGVYFLSFESKDGEIGFKQLIK